MPVYLDNNASAPVRPEAAAMAYRLLLQKGNASSVHSFGREMRGAVEEARASVAALAGAQASQVVFTSSATEANNMVLRHFKPAKVAVSAIEHPSVRQVHPQCLTLPVTADGLVDVSAAKAGMSKLPEGSLVSLMLVNNETGVIQPVRKIAAKARKRGLYIHCDAVQAAGRIAVDIEELEVDFLTLSAHKLGGPMGVGALIIRRGVAPPAPIFSGGGQERRVRPGTENVPAIGGFGVSAQLALKEIDQFQKLSALRDKMEEKIRQEAPQTIIYGAHARRVSNTSCFGLAGIHAQMLVMKLDLAGIAVSSGAACSSGVVRESPVILAMGASPEAAASTIRVSMGWQTLESDIDHFIKIWSNIIGGS